MLRALLKTMRPRQWVKNGVIFAALVFDHHLFQLTPLARTAAGFILLCALSSTVYIVNDLADIEKDRQHPKKHLRPLASGALKKETALVFATRLIDTEYQFNGTRALAGQALQWPRSDCREPDGNTAGFVTGQQEAIPQVVIPGSNGQIVVVKNTWTVPEDLVPKAVVEATCELARELLIADRTATPPGEGLKYYNDAGTQTGYDKEDRRPVIPALVQALLAKYGSRTNSKSGAVQLVRA